MSPEEKARLEIDRKLELAGYVIQDMKEFDPIAALGVAVREYPTNVGEADYVLFIDRMPIGVIEAKATDKGEKLLIAADQSLGYAQSGLKYFVESKPLRFTYEATDILTNFCDLNDPNARTRQIFSFHKPETLLNWMNNEVSLRNQLRKFPPFDNRGFRDCQTRAIVNLEKSFAENRPRALIQMAIGAGKTFTAIKKLTDIVSIIRFELGYSKELDLYAAEVNLKFRDWMLKKNGGYNQFSEEQTQWLRMIRDHIVVSLSVTKNDLDLDPFGEQGGLGKFYQLFGNKYEEILDEINKALAA